MFLHQIAITSETGVGSSALLTALQKRNRHHEYRWESGGEIFRRMGRERGMEVGQFAAHCRAHPKEGNDKKLDAIIIEMAKVDWLVCESRLAHIDMPEAFKILLVCDIELRIDRRHRDQPHLTRAQVARGIYDRDHDDRIRYEALYPGCMWEPCKFDLVLDTGKDGGPDELADKVVLAHYHWAESFRVA